MAVTAGQFLADVEETWDVVIQMDTMYETGEYRGSFKVNEK